MRAPPEDFGERLEGVDMRVISSSFEKKTEENINLLNLLNLDLAVNFFAMYCSSTQEAHRNHNQLQPFRKSSSDKGIHSSCLRMG